MTNLGGYVLAGGEGHRMGAEKSALLLGGRSLLQIAVDKLRGVCGNAAVLCGQHCERAAKCAEAVPDLRESGGPLCGVEAALAHSIREWNLVLAVDVPLLPVALLHAWTADFISTAGTASVLVHDGVAQPLPLLIRTSALPHVQDALNAGRFTLREVMEEAAIALGGRLERIPTETYICRTAVPRAAWFANANYPSDLEHLRALQAKMDGAA
ncbi:MAG: molybdenum cofactor guanylyltransferase [Acidobacteria bacterium]|nr:molybdenum cofactor guanylyltransferase [Acidobacteriota bacterium]